MAMLTVRVATRDDFQDIVGLYQAVSAEVSGTDNDPIWEVGVYPTHEDIQGYLDAEELYVAEKDGRIAGAIVATSNTEEGYKDVAWVSDIPVEDSAVIHLFGMHPDLRGQGLARPFMEAVEEKLRIRGERIMRLDVIAANVGAQRVYDRFGFTHCGTAWLEYPDYQGDFAFYEKEL